MEIITVVALRSRPQRPSDLNVSRSETSKASGCKTFSNVRTGPGSTARYPPVNGISLAGTVIRTTPSAISVRAVSTRDDEKHLVACGAILSARPVDGGTEAAGARSVEVGDLSDTHIASRTGARVRSTI